jgi:hypothetical protein
MITLKEIATAINEKLKEVLPHIPIQSKDISEGYERPALFVDFDNTTNAQFGARGKERRIQVIIYFFPSDRYKNKIEILEVQEILEQAFTGHFEIKEGFVVYPMEVSSIKVDGVFQFSFEIHYIEIDDTETGEDVDSININLVKER